MEMTVPNSEILTFNSNPKEPILQFFEYSHLPDNLQRVSYQFKILAEWMVSQLPRNPERTVALRNLLLARDAAVRSQIYREDY